MALATSIPVDALGHYAGIGTINDTEVLVRSGQNVQGETRAVLSASLAALSEAITLAPDATYDWDSTALSVGVTHAAATCVISLPVEASVTNRVPGTPPRKLYKLNSTVNDIDLMAGPTCTINGAAAGTDMTPVPGSALQPSDTVNAPYWLVYRRTATAYHVLGFVS
jgi:hypothetical protein